jgi:hypothetical protein
MGQSTDAYLFYGFDFWDEDMGDFPWGDDAYEKLMDSDGYEAAHSDRRFPRGGEEVCPRFIQGKRT